MTMRVLLFAPQSDLPAAQAEVQAILRSGLDVTPVIGHVQHGDVVREVSGGEHDVFWFSGHCTEDGLVLNDGTLSASLLTPLIRGRFDTVVLNTCDGVNSAIMLQNETGAEIICTVAEVPDKEAYQTGALFARHLAKSESVEDAYNASKPGGNRLYVRLAGKKK